LLRKIKRDGMIYGKKAVTLQNNSNGITIALIFKTFT